MQKERQFAKQIVDKKQFHGQIINMCCRREKPFVVKKCFGKIGVVLRKQETYYRLSDTVNGHKADINKAGDQQDSAILAQLLMPTRDDQHDHNGVEKQRDNETNEDANLVSAVGHCS